MASVNKRPFASTSSSTSSSSKKLKGKDKGKSEVRDTKLNRRIAEFGYRFDDDREAYSGDSIALRKGLDKLLLDSAKLNDFKNALEEYFQGKRRVYSTVLH